MPQLQPGAQPVANVSPVPNCPRLRGVTITLPNARRGDYFIGGSMKTARRHLFGMVAIFPFVALVISAIHSRWDAAAAYATVLVGFIAAEVVVWQGYLIKRQLAFSTYLDLDKEWNSQEMIKSRRAVRAPGSTEWNHSRLEGILEFFEKVASMFKLSGEMPFIYQSTLGWYAAQYFLFAHEHGQIKYLRDLWQDSLYQDLEDLYTFYLENEVGRSPKAQQDWKDKRLATEDKFWEQERKD
jgi:hypothetical protein